LDARYCPYCGDVVLGIPQASFSTHSVGFAVMAVLVSFLWFHVNNVKILPLGLVGGILLAYWSHDIDVRSGKQSVFLPTLVVCFIATVIGFIIR
jgi:hypothetical protein